MTLVLLPSHGWGRRFNPCIAHHFPRLSAAFSKNVYAEPCKNARGRVAQFWHSLFSACSPPLGLGICVGPDGLVRPVMDDAAAMSRDSAFEGAGYPAFDKGLMVGTEPVYENLHVEEAAFATVRVRAVPRQASVRGDNFMESYRVGHVELFKNIAGERVKE